MDVLIAVITTPSLNTDPGICSTIKTMGFYALRAHEQDAEETMEWMNGWTSGQVNVERQEDFMYIYPQEKSFEEIQRRNRLLRQDVGPGSGGPGVPG